MSKENSMTNVLHNDAVIDALFSKYSALGDELEARLAAVDADQSDYSVRLVRTALKKQREAVAQAIERLVPPLIKDGDTVTVTTYSYEPRGDFCEGEKHSGCVVEIDGGQVKVRIPANSIVARSTREHFISATWEGTRHGWVDIASDDEWRLGNCY
jgi:hypothetical protein